MKKELNTNWREINLKQWASEMGVDLTEIDHKLQLKDRIVKLRKEQDLTQQDLANLVGISRARIAQIESGIRLHKMSFDILFKVVRALGYDYKITTKKAA